MCSADISMAYWWNKNYTYKDEDGVEHFTQEYLDKTPKERSYGSFLMWDVEHQCRNLDLIADWVAKLQLRDDAYIRAGGGIFVINYPDSIAMNRYVGC
jgi:hypothetical protein